MEQIKERMSQGLTIGRIPGKTYNRFVTLSKEDFCMDYGMCIKFLLDFYDGLIQLPNETIMGLFDQMQSQIDELKQRIEKQPEQEEVKRTLSGKRIG